VLGAALENLAVGNTQSSCGSHEYVVPLFRKLTMYQEASLRFATVVHLTVLQSDRLRLAQDGTTSNGHIHVAREYTAVP
jgi:hypothetical protein